MSSKSLEDVLGKLGEATGLLQTTVKTKQGRKNIETDTLKDDLTPIDVGNVLVLLKDAIKSLAELLQDDQKKVKEKESDSETVNKIRQIEDELDEVKQKRFKGKFIISSVAGPGKECMIKPKEEVKDEELVDHVRELAWEKFAVKVPATDILSCKRLQSGAIMVSLWIWYGSSYYRLSDAIKSSKNFAYNVFFNFMLTKRRNELLYEVRKLKRAKKIDKFFSDDRGHITIKLGEKSEKISSVPLETNKTILKTYTLPELETLINQWTC